MGRQIAATLSNYAEAWLHLDGKPFRLDLYPMLREIYDGRYRKLMLLAARQVTKSTTLCSMMTLEAILKDHFRSVYIGPSQKAARYFSISRVGKTLKFSPALRAKYSLPELVNRVEHKELANGSEMLFLYANESEEDADRLRGPSSDHNCYDKDAYVLTWHGWVPVSGLVPSDLVADVNDDGQVEWHKPTLIFSKKYTGPMVTLEHRGFHLRVTGDHKFWLNYRVKSSSKYHQEDKWVFEKALDAANTSRMGFKLTSKAAWGDATPEYRIFGGTPTRENRKCEALKLPYKNFARLVGWYLSEGSVNWHKTRTCNRPIISQNVGRGFKDICNTLDQCNLPYTVSKVKGRNKIRTIYILSETLGQYFKPLGKSRDKYIPREFFQSATLLEQVLQGIYLGDACYHKGEQWQHGTLKTRSRRLAEDVQEAWLRLGRPAVIHTRMQAPNDHSPKEPMYHVCSYNRDYLIFWRADFKKKKRVKIEEVKQEEVFCFTVKNHRPIVKGSFKSLGCIGSQCFDEVQDMLYDPIIIVGNEMMSKSQYKYETYTGTPKSMENTIQFLWEQSTQTEWVMKCDGCGKYTYIDGEKFIGKGGPICIKCGHLLNPFEGQWVDMSPGKDFKGFHISQPNLPENVPYAMRNSSNKMKELAQMNWTILLNKYETFPISKFRNEILGVSDAIGARLISKEELESLCCSYHIQQVPAHAHLKGLTMIVGGVDWSGGGTTGVSRTVLWIWGLVKETQKLRCLFYKVFPGTHPVETCQEIGEICKQYHVTLVVADAGEGHHANGELRKIIGAHRLMPLQYGSQAKALVYNGVDRYTGNRTTLIDNYLMMLKQKRVEFACLEDMRAAITDILSEYEEVTTTGNKVWRHSPQRPDDCLHAGLYAWLAWKITTSDLLFYQ
jgi:hypothetical protein